MATDDEKLENPQEDVFYLEELHSSLVVVKRHAWLILFTLLLIGFFILLWGFFGSIPIEVRGDGIFMSKEGVFSVENIFQGVVKEVLVSPKDEIEKDQRLILVQDPEIEVKLKAAENKLQTLKEHLDRLTKQVKIENQALSAASQEELEATYFTIKSLKNEIPQLEEIVQNKANLYEQGLISVENLREAEFKKAEKEIQLEQAESKVKAVEAKIAREYRTEEIKQKERDLLQAKEEYDLLQTRFNYAYLRSPSEGKILEVKTRLGDHLDIGEKVIWGEFPTEYNAHLVYAFIPVEKGKRISVDDEVQINVPTIESNEYGLMKGKVIELSKFALSPKGVEQVVQNQGLANYLTRGETGFLLAVIQPLVDTSTPSGYAWTSGKGPNEKITTGTVCKVMVTVKEVAPLYYLFPLWKIKKVVPHEL